MKKYTKIIIIASVLCCLLIAPIIAKAMMKTGSLMDFCGDDVSLVESVYIIGGSNGNSVKLEKEDYQKVFNILQNIKYEKKHFEQSTGWTYCVQVKVNGELIEYVFSENKCVINNEDYEIDNIELQEDIGAIWKEYTNKK